jgi:uncharacterized iron-regulated membrane protein
VPEPRAPDPPEPLKDIPMLTIVKRVVGALLALVGLALTVVGVWFATQLGSSGTAELTARPDTTDPLVLPPDVLNRLDADVTVTASSKGGTGSVWMALANPSDADAVLGTARHVEVTGASVRDWALTTTTRGSGAAGDPAEADLWRQQDEGQGSATLTVRQSEAPETMVIAADGAPLGSVTYTVVDETWFVEAVVAALVGLFLLVVGVLLLWPRRHRRTADVAVPAEPTTPDVEQAPPTMADPSDAPDPEEVTR